MATEYRIPITIEMQEAAKNDPIKQSSEMAKDAIPQNEVSEQITMVSLIGTTHKVLGEASKLISASGNAEAAKGLRVIGKVLGIGASIASGNYIAAAIQTALEIAQMGLKSVTEMRQQAMQDNLANINNIRLGRVVMKGGVVSTSTNAFGRINYNVN